MFPLCHRGTRRRKLFIISLLTPLCLHLHLRLSRSLYHRWATTVDSIIIFLHSLRFSAFSSMLFHSRPVHSMMLSSHRFLCLPLRLLCTVPCRIVSASLDDLVTGLYHFSLRLFNMPSGDNMLNNILLLTLVCCRTQDQQKIFTKQLEFCGHGDACNTCARWQTSVKGETTINVLRCVDSMPSDPGPKEGEGGEGGEGGGEFEFFGDCHALVAWISRHHQHQQPLAVGGL